MTEQVPTRLNDSGEVGVARVVQGGAVHFSRGQSTRRHAHNAWKVHVGLDAPVWLRCDNANVVGDKRVVIVPPNVPHTTGAIGWSVAVFIEPGSRDTAWRSEGSTLCPPIRRSQRILDICRQLDPSRRETTFDLVDAVAAELSPTKGEAPDRRVVTTLDALGRDPDASLTSIARNSGLSLDHLSRLVHQQTGLTLRRHRLWARLMTALPLLGRANNLADAAVQAGFSDHAHMTRTFRAFLGRVPSDFALPPDVLQGW